MRLNKTHLKTTSFFSLKHLHWHEKAHDIVPFHLKIKNYWNYNYDKYLNFLFLNYIKTYITHSKPKLWINPEKRCMWKSSTQCSLGLLEKQ